MLTVNSLRKQDQGVHTANVDLLLFDEVADAMVSLLPPELGAVRYRAQRYGIKAWFGGERPEREHYEAQVMGASAMDEAKVLALELGFHAEHPDEALNQAVLDRLVARERTWRPRLGAAAEAGPFLGRREDWRRLSELWADPDLSDPEVAFEIASRLVDYMTVLEPIRTA
jgi:hypothetical protein